MVERNDTVYSLGIKYHLPGLENTKTKSINYINMPPRYQEKPEDLQKYYDFVLAINTSIVGGVLPTVVAGEESQLTDNGV